MGYKVFNIYSCVDLKNTHKKWDTGNLGLFKYIFLNQILLLFSDKSCGNVPLVVHGSCKVVQRKAFYTCKKGYAVLGEGSIYCDSHGRWSQAPLCLRKSINVKASRTWYLTFSLLIVASQYLW